ncbi:MAG TPA: DUF2798 domain-containing protein [Faecalibacter sp.]
MIQMPVNKREHLVYTFLMVIVMCLGMTSYNVIQHEGFTLEALKKTWLLFPITYTIAFAVEWFFVGKSAMYLISKFVKETDPLPKKILISALCFVTQMVIIMSTICSLLFSEFNDEWFFNWLKAIPTNFIMAYPLQVIFAGPFVGIIFRKLFPLGTIVEIEK